MNFIWWFYYLEDKNNNEEMKIIIIYGKHQYVMNYIACNVYKIKYYFLHTHFRHNFNVYVSCKECINIY